MASEIKTWQIVNDKLVDVSSTLAKQGRNEPEHLEQWVLSNSEILGHNLLIIGRQVVTQSGPIDLLAIDDSGNLVVVELKRGRLPREALAQAIDYAACIANWSIDKISEQCIKYLERSLDDALSDRFPDIDVENINVNESQRLVLVGCSIDPSLERMIEWLSNTTNVNINAIILSYVKTLAGEELLTRTALVSEEVVIKKTKGEKKFQIPMSDEPGIYDKETLRTKLVSYLSKNMKTAQRIRDVLIPACLRDGTVTRDQLCEAFLSFDGTIDPSKTGYLAAIISSQMGLARNDFLRQVISYEYPRNQWEKDNYAIRHEYRTLIQEVVAEVKNQMCVIASGSTTDA